MENNEWPKGMVITDIQISVDQGKTWHKVVYSEELNKPPKVKIHPIGGRGKIINVDRKNHLGETQK